MIANASWNRDAYIIWWFEEHIESNSNIDKLCTIIGIRKSKLCIKPSWHVQSMILLFHYHIKCLNDKLTILQVEDVKVTI